MSLNLSLFDHGRIPNGGGFQTFQYHNDMTQIREIIYQITAKDLLNHPIKSNELLCVTPLTEGPLNMAIFLFCQCIIDVYKQAHG